MHYFTIASQHAGALAPLGTAVQVPSFGAKYSSTMTALLAVGADPVWVYFTHTSNPPFDPLWVAPAPVACVPEPVAASVSAVTPPAPACTLCAATSSLALPGET